MRWPRLSIAAFVCLSAALAAPSPVSAGEIKYTVKEGESLSRICQEVYGDRELFSLVAFYNGKEDPEKLSPGETVRLPFSEKVVVREGESLSRIAQRVWKDAKKFTVIAWANDIRDPARVPAGTRIAVPVLVPFRLPRGESVSSTARRFYGDPKEYAPILSASGIEEPGRIPAGSLLLVPYRFPDPEIKSPGKTDVKKDEDSGLEKARALLTQAEEAFRAGKVGDAWNSGYEASKGLAGLEKARALRLLAACQYAFRRMDEALADLAAAYELDPEFKPDPAFVNPELMVLYERAKGVQ